MTDRITSRCWYGWELDPDIPALIFEGEPGLSYRVDFDRLVTAAGVLFWIVQVSEKPWGAHALAGFVEAVNEILSPQTNLRGSQAFTPESVREQVAAFQAAPR